MMFMIPIPPTRRETPATAVRSSVIVLVAALAFSIIWAMLRTVKSSSPPSRIRCLIERSDVTWSWAAPSNSELWAFTMMVETEPDREELKSLLWAVVTGTRTMSSWSLPMGFVPISPRTPTTTMGTFLTRRVFPIGSSPPKRLSTMVFPTTQTLVALLTSWSVKTVPDPTAQSWTKR